MIKSHLFRFVFAVSLTAICGIAHSQATGDINTLTKTVNDRSVSGISVKYNIPAFTRTEVTNMGETWQYIHIDGMGKMREPGKPALPASTEIIAVPFNSNMNLISSSESYTDYPGYRIHPAQQAPFDTYGAPDPPFEIDSSLYLTDAFFPEKLAEVVDTLLVRGMRLAVVQLRSVQYNPVRGIIRVHRGVNFDLSFSGTNPSFEQLAVENTAFYLSALKRLVLNANSLPHGNTHGINTNRADYLIVTIDNYLDAADSIAKWRNQMGYTTKIISRASWTSQAVKDSIHNSYNNWLPRPDYLLILGDHDHVPAEVFGSGSAAFPTDLYYVCMDGSADHFPDMAKGRISVSSAAQAITVAQKMINYERYPLMDTLFYAKALHCAQFQDDDTNGYASRRFTHTSEEMRDYAMSKGYDVQRIYHTYTHVTPTNYNNAAYSNGEPIPAELLRSNGFLWNGNQTQIAQAINDGRFYVLHRDHGYVGGSGWAHPYFTTASMNQLSNGNKLPVVFSINCHTGEFSLAECFAEKFIRLPNGGAVGVFAASHASYSGYNDAVTGGFFDAIWNDPGIVPVFGTGGISNPSVSSHPPILAMGDVLNHGMLRMVQTWNGSTNANRRQYRLFHYFGDPAMKMWTSAPAEIYAQLPDTIVAGSTHIGINSLNVSDVMATAFYKGELISRALADSGNSSLYFAPVNDASHTLTITLSKYNYRPLIKEIVIVANAPSLNNTACDALHIPVKKYCDFIASSFAGASASPLPLPSCGANTGNDVWFSFTVPLSGKAHVEVFSAQSGLGLTAYSGNCNLLSELACDTSILSQGVIQLNLQNLNTGDTILIRVWQNHGNAPQIFSVCAREPDTFVYAALPYYTGFETGIDQYWELYSSHTAGRIRLDTVCDARYGNASLLMDVSTNGIFVQNEARLRVNLRDKQNVKCSFWWREYGDENHVQDGIFLSDDGGETYVKVVELRGDFEAWTQYILDVDKLAALHGMKLTESFIIKFQQYDNWQFICSNPTGGDGFAFDEIYVYEDTSMNAYASIPYYTGFEDGFDQYWSIQSGRIEGRIVVTGIQSPYAGDYHLMMDVSSSGNYVRNDADLRLNLTGLNNLVLSFRWKNINNENHIEDGVYFSDNGGESFVKVMSLNDTNTYWSHKNLNINSLAAAHNLNITSNFVIRFTQYDNFPVPSDGFAFDDIEVYQSSYALIDLSGVSISFAADTGATHTRNFHLLNPGTSPLVVGSFILPYAFSTGFNPPVSILPGDSISVGLTFSPDSVGNFTGYMKFYHNATYGLDSLWLNGLGMYREVIANVASVEFDSLPIQSADTVQFNITNIGNGNVRLTGVSVPAAFSVLSNTNINIAPGQSRPVRIRFAPFMQGTYSGQIVITTNANIFAVPVNGVAVDPTGIDKHSVVPGFSIAPNPFIDVLYLENLNNHEYTLKIYDVSGRLLKELTAAESRTLQLDQLSAGVYLLEVVNHSLNESGIIRVVKM